MLLHPLSQALGLRLTSSQRNKRSRRTRHSTSSNRLYKTLSSVGAGVVGSSWRCRARSRIYKPYQSVSLFKLCARIAYPLSQALGLRLTSSQRNKRSRRTRHNTSSNKLYKTLSSVGAGVVGSSWWCRARSRIYKPYQSVSQSVCSNYASASRIRSPRAGGGYAMRAHNLNRLTD